MLVLMPRTVYDDLHEAREEIKRLRALIEQVCQELALNDMTAWADEIRTAADAGE